MTKRGRPRKERYARLMGGFWRNDKIRRLSLEARGLLATAWSYAADQATDGRVPLELLEAWAKRRFKPIMAELTAGERPLLTVAEGDIDAVARDWDDVNITSAEWEKRLESDRKRKRKGGDPPIGKGSGFPTGKSGGNPTGTPESLRRSALDEDEDEDEDDLPLGSGSRPPPAREERDPGVVGAREELLAHVHGALKRGWDARHATKLAAPSAPVHSEDLKPLARWCVEYLETHPGDPDELCSRLLDGFWSRSDLDRPTPKWLAEDPLRYVNGADARAGKARQRRRKTDRLPPGTGIGFSEDDIAPAPAQREVSYG